MEPVESFDYKHHRVDIYQDIDSAAGNPREWDNLGIMFAEGNRRYELGDKAHATSKYYIGASDYALAKEAFETCLERHGWDGIPVWERWLRMCLGTTVVLPLWLYDHSGLAMSTSDFPMDSAHWDSGIVGFIFDTKKTRELLGVAPEQVAEQLVSEVAQYDAYLQGSVYGYTVTHIPTGIEVDSCWGYLVVDEKDMECLREDAKAAA